MDTHPLVVATYCHCIALVTPYRAQNCTKKTSSSPSLTFFPMSIWGHNTPIYCSL